MTQVALGVGIPAARENPASLLRRAIDDVTRSTTTSGAGGRRDSTFESIERRFRADLSRRLRRLRAQVEDSRAAGGRRRSATDPRDAPTTPAEMPTIAARPPAGAWRMPRPARRHSVSYQSVTPLAVLSPLAVTSPRASTSSVPPPPLSRRRTIADELVTSPRDAGWSRDSIASPNVAGSCDSMTSPEVGGSRDSMTSPVVAGSRGWMTSSVGDLSDAFVATATCSASESDLSPTAGGTADVMANYSSSVEHPETSNRPLKHEDERLEPVGRPGEYSDEDIQSDIESNALAVNRAEIDDKMLGMVHGQDNAETPKSREQPATSRNPPSTSTIGNQTKSNSQLLRHESEENYAETGFDPLKQRSSWSATVVDRPTSAAGSSSPSTLANISRYRPQTALRKYSVDVVSTSSSSQKETGSSLQKMRRSVSKDRAMNGREVFRRSEAASSDDDVFLPLSPASHHGQTTFSAAVAPPGGMGEASPYGWTSKNYVIWVCFHCHGTSSYHTTNTLQGRRVKSHVDTQTIQPGLGDFVLLM